MVCQRMSLVASCYIWQCGLIWQVSVQFFCLQEGATGKTALGLISSLIRRTANISDKDIWWREVHSSRLASLKPELFSLDCFRQYAHLDKQCMQCLHAGRQRGICCLALTQTQRQVINLCKATNIHPVLYLPRRFSFLAKLHNVYNYKTAHYDMWVLLNHVHQPTYSETMRLQTTALHARCWQ